MQGLLVSHILFITVCEATVIVNFNAEIIERIEESFNTHSSTYCDWEINDKTFIAPKIIVASLKFIEAHMSHVQNDADWAITTDMEKRLANPQYVLNWSEDHSSEKMYDQLEQLYVDKRIKPLTVINIVAQWHAQFSQTYYSITDSANEYISVHNSNGNSIWHDGVHSKQCLKGMYLQIVLHVFTVPESLRRRTFEEYFGKHKNIANSLCEIDDIWITYRKAHIQSYEKRGIISKYLKKYSEKQDFLCDAFDSEHIRGPRLLQHVLQKIRHSLKEPQTLNFGSVNPQDHELKTDLFRGRVTPSSSYRLNDAVVFVAYYFRLLLPSLDLLGKAQHESDDVMGLLLTSLTESGLNYCLIGGILKCLHSMKQWFNIPWFNIKPSIYHMLIQPITNTDVERKDKEVINVIRDLTSDEKGVIKWQADTAKSYWQRVNNPVALEDNP